MKVPFLCTSQRLWAQEAPFYGPFGDSGFAEDSILNAGDGCDVYEARVPHAGVKPIEHSQAAG